MALLLIIERILTTIFTRLHTVRKEDRPRGGRVETVWTEDLIADDSTHFSARSLKLLPLFLPRAKGKVNDDSLFRKVI